MKATDSEQSAPSSGESQTKSELAYDPQLDKLGAIVDDKVYETQAQPEATLDTVDALMDWIIETATETYPERHKELKMRAKVSIQRLILDGKIEELKALGPLVKDHDGNDMIADILDQRITDLTKKKENL